MESLYDSIQVAKHVSWPKWVKIEVLLYEVPYIISYAELNGTSIPGIMQNLASFGHYLQFFHALRNFH